MSSPADFMTDLVAALNTSGYTPIQSAAAPLGHRSELRIARGASASSSFLADTDEIITANVTRRSVIADVTILARPADGSPEAQATTEAAMVSGALTALTASSYYVALTSVAQHPIPEIEITEAMAVTGEVVHFTLRATCVLES